MASELSVTVKDAEKRLVKRHLIYEDYQAKDDDPIVEQCIRETVKEFGSEPESIKVRINIEVR